MLTQNQLKDALNYDPETGVFTWITPPNYAGGNKHGVAGSKNSNGYILICYLGKSHRAHRLAWLYVTGSWPENQIDHINRIRDDNRIANLRDVTNLENNLNKGKPKDRPKKINLSKCGATGKWLINIEYKGELIYFAETKKP